MITWLKDNPIGTGLTAFCGVLVLIIILLMVLWTLPPSGAGMTSEEGESIASLDLPELRDAGKIEDYDEIISRPVFNESRQPIIETGEDEEVAEEETMEDVDAPDVELAGVIITPSIRMATLKERGQDQSMVAFVGRPLDGDYGSWQITSIEPRTVMLTSGDGEELELKLQVHNAKIAEPPKTQVPLSEPAEESESDDSEEQQAVQTLSRAEEIRQRIAERREELKRAAESGESDQSMTYQEAIQNMMGKKRQDNSNNDQKE